MENLNLRQAILLRVQEKDGIELQDIIEGSIDHDERALPGLGVLFEMIWKQSDSGQQSAMVQSLHDHLHNK